MISDYSRAQHGRGRPGDRRRRRHEVPDGVGRHLPHFGLATLLQPLKEFRPREFLEAVVTEILRIERPVLRIHRGSRGTKPCTHLHLNDLLLQL